ncbi:MAG: DUF3786 domain-containing protein, partial [Nitrososphaerales archaeon]
MHLFDAYESKGLRRGEGVEERWFNKLLTLFESKSWADLIRGARFLKADLTGSLTDASLKTSFMGLDLIFDIKPPKIDLYYVDRLEKPRHYAQYLPIAVNCFERGCLSKSEPPLPSVELVSIARFGGADTMRGYDRVFASQLLGIMPKATLEEMKKVTELVGGRVIEHLDAQWAYEIEPLASVRVRFAYWSGDEELPPHVSTLYGAETL